MIACANTNAHTRNKWSTVSVLHTHTHTHTYYTCILYTVHNTEMCSNRDSTVLQRPNKSCFQFNFFCFHFPCHWGHNTCSRFGEGVVQWSPQEALMNTLISGHCRCHKFTYIQVYTSPSPTPTCSHYNLLNGLLELEKNKDFLEKK